MVWENSSSVWTPQRKVKRKLSENNTGMVLRSPSMSSTTIPLPIVDVFGRLVTSEEQCVLRETVAKQQVTIQNLYIELDEERNASASAANEAMSMILRLQREKAEIHMEARQFKRYVEEKIVHDQNEIDVLEETIDRREQEIRALSYEIQVYRHRLISYENELEPLDLPGFLPVKCRSGRSLLAIEEKDGIGRFTQQEMELLREIAVNLSKSVEKSKKMELRKPWFLGFSDLRFDLSLLIKVGLVFLCGKHLSRYRNHLKRTK